MEQNDQYLASLGILRCSCGEILGKDGDGEVIHEDDCYNCE